MRARPFFSLLGCLFIPLAACEKRAAPPLSQDSQGKSPPTHQESGPAKFDACGLIKKEEIEAVQGSPITETKSSGRSNAGLHTAQCFYLAAEFSKSVSFSVTRRDPDSPNIRRIKDVWKETFSRYQTQEKEEEGDKEKKESLRQQQGERGEEQAPLKKIDGIGDEAYWSAARVVGALYVLKNDAFIRISVGGNDDAETKLNKSKTLAEKALGRLSQ